MGLFIAFEGGEGCGKTTQAKLLTDKLQQHSIPVVLTHDPGGTALGNEIRRLLKKERGCPISPQAELFLFAASRVQLVAELIRPALEEDKVVVCDRFAYSTAVYQGYGRGLDPASVEMINNMATQNLEPDLNILLDISPEQGLARKQNLRDRFESENLSFHRRVRDGYVKLAGAQTDRWLTIDGTLPKMQIAEIIWDKVNKLLLPSS
ncbi:MAG: dTMP kinase [Dehalococcoidia bacterium]